MPQLQCQNKTLLYVAIHAQGSYIHALRICRHHTIGYIFGKKKPLHGTNREEAEDLGLNIICNANYHRA